MLLVGRANDHVGYATTLAEYQLGGYEAESTVYGAQTGAMVVDAVSRVVDRVR